MKKVVIFSGGTGSTNLQKGLYNLYGDCLDLKIIINAYDNGLSTGAVRKVFDGNILGPSDLRKNQILQAKLYNYEDTKHLIKFLEKRFFADSAEKAKDKLIQLMWETENLEIPIQNTFLNAIKFFFDKSNSTLIDYQDFSVANVIYAGLAGQQGNSLEAAGFRMAEILGIPKDRVLLASDDSLFLHAETEDGTIVLDEGDIVSWDNPENKITGINLVDKQHKQTRPFLSPTCADAIMRADIIIFSSGTQWSSLIPTYIHQGFKQALDASEAKRYFIVNNTEDKDMIGLDVNDIIDVLSEYLPVSELWFVQNTEAHKSMSKTIDPKRYSSIRKDLSMHMSTLHDPEKLVDTIFQDYYNNVLDPEYIILDFDDTIYGRKEYRSDISFENLGLLYEINHHLAAHIVSGNGASHFERVLSGRYKASLDFFCDGGNTYCSYDPTNKKHPVKELSQVSSEYTWDKYDFKTLTKAMKALKIPAYKVENRKSVLYSLKPFHDHERKQLFENLQNSMGDDYECQIAGRTSIDVRKRGYDKTIVFQKLGKPYRSYVVAIGDEMDEGNDACFRTVPWVQCISVDSHLETFIYLKTLWRSLINEEEDTTDNRSR